MRNCRANAMLIVTTLITIMIVGLTACGAKNPVSTDNKGTVSSSDVSGNIDHSKASVGDVSPSDGSAEDTPQEDGTDGETNPVGGDASDIGDKEEPGKAYDSDNIIDDGSNEPVVDFTTQPSEVEPKETKNTGANSEFANGEWSIDGIGTIDNSVNDDLSAEDQEILNQIYADYEGEKEGYIYIPGSGYIKNRAVYTGEVDVDDFNEWAIAHGYAPMD